METTTKAAHTPGPWDIEPRYTKVSRGRGRPMATRTSYDVGNSAVVVAEVQTVADARLIAVSPELLACVEASTVELIAERESFYDGVSRPDGYIPDPEDAETLARLDAVIDANRAAIAKARGGEATHA